MDRVRPDIAFRTEANRRIGFGHLSRCLNLAHYLRLIGLECAFLTSEETLKCFPDGISKFNVIPVPARLSEEQDAQACLDALKAELPVLIVVDNYSLGVAWERIVAQAPMPVAVIDDLNRKHACRVLIDYNARLDYAAVYRNCAPSNLLLLGPRFAVLNENFKLLRQNLSGWHDRSRRVHLCFGGSDPRDATNFSAQALKSHLPGNVPIELVTGAGYADVDALRAVCGNALQMQIVHNPPDLPSRMADAKLGIGAGGTMNWERCAMGLPAIVISTAENQRPSSAVLHELGIVNYLGDLENVTAERLSHAAADMLQDDSALHDMSLRGLGLVDGRGTKRVASQLVSLLLNWVPAGPEHCEPMFHWRNHPENRRTAIAGSAELDPAAHSSWFNRVLSSPSSKLYIPHFRNQPAGVLRIDLLKAREAMVSVYLVPGCHQKKLGLPIILGVPELLKEISPPIVKLLARIKHGNPASSSIFSDAGYTCVNSGPEQEFSEWERSL